MYIQRVQERHRRKRRTKKAVKIVLLLLAVLLICAGAARKKRELTDYRWVSCSSLWELAVRYCPADMDKRDYIACVMSENAMEDCTVYPGRLYRVPIYE